MLNGSDEIWLEFGSSAVHEMTLLLCGVRAACLCVLLYCSLASASGQHPTSSTTEEQPQTVYAGGSYSCSCCSAVLEVHVWQQHLLAVSGRLWTSRHDATSTP
jgi:hypothetical protein